jgi:hypothetical protein
MTSILVRVSQHLGTSLCNRRSRLGQHRCATPQILQRGWSDHLQSINQRPINDRQLHGHSSDQVLHERLPCQRSGHAQLHHRRPMKSSVQQLRPRRQRVTHDVGSAA